MRKEALRLDLWAKEVAPSNGLRQWFSHDPAKWEEFCRRYSEELEANQTSWEPILEQGRKSCVTLLFGASDTERNNAVALRRFLERKLKSAPK